MFWNSIIIEHDISTVAAQWIDISEISNWKTSEMVKALIEDYGLEIFGFLHYANHRSSWFIGLGEDHAGKNCRDTLRSILSMP